METSAKLIVLQNLSQVCRSFAQSLKEWKDSEKQVYLNKSKTYLEEVIEKVKTNQIQNDPSLRLSDLQRKMANVRK